MFAEKEENNLIQTTELYHTMKIMTIKTRWHEGYTLRYVQTVTVSPRNVRTDLQEKEKVKGRLQ